MIEAILDPIGPLEPATAVEKQAGAVLVRLHGHPLTMSPANLSEVRKAEVSVLGLSEDDEYVAVCLCAVADDWALQGERPPEAFGDGESHLVIILEEDNEDAKDVYEALVQRALRGDPQPFYCQDGVSPDLDYPGMDELLRHELDQCVERIADLRSVGDYEGLFVELTTRAVEGEWALVSSLLEWHALGEIDDDELRGFLLRMFGNYYLSWRCMDLAIEALRATGFASDFEGRTRPAGVATVYRGFRGPSPTHAGPYWTSSLDEARNYATADPRSEGTVFSAQLECERVLGIVLLLSKDGGEIEEWLISPDDLYDIRQVEHHEPLEAESLRSGPNSLRQR